MPNILKPDLKSAVWLGIGFLVVPYLMNLISSRR